MVKLVAECAFLGVLVAACGAPPETLAADGPAQAESTPDAGPIGDPPRDLFDPDQLLDIDIDIDVADWDVLRRQHRDVFGQFSEDCPAPLPASPYDYFPATVTVDGERVAQVGLRKKGTMGSVSPLRPSLKVSFDEYVRGQRLHGLRRMTLNNNLQDPSRISTCLAFGLFRRAGVPAPRCNFARVTVNGTYLGVYSHVESVKSEFLARELGDPGGNLYEGAAADFRPVWVDNYEAKGEPEGDRSDLAAVVTALEAEDGDLVARLDEVLDVDAFLTFWAVELLVGHWDGYAASRNNHFVYREPTSDRFYFIPWGPDAAFGDQNAFVRELPPASVWAGAKLPRRLYGNPETRARYVERLEQLLAEVWDETALLAEVDRMQSLLAGHVLDLEAFAAGLRRVRDYIGALRGLVEASLAEQPDWTAELPDSFCFEVAGTVSGSFDATWGEFPADNPFETGSGLMSVRLDGQDELLVAFGSNVGQDGARGTEGVGLVLTGLRLDLTTLVSVMFIDPELYRPDATIEVDGFDVFGLLVEADAESYVVIGYTRGTLVLHDAAARVGGRVTGSFELEVLRDLAMM